MVAATVPTKAGGALTCGFSSKSGISPAAPLSRHRVLGISGRSRMRSSDASHNLWRLSVGQPVLSAPIAALP
jgi:hypothetical protein